MRCGKSTTEEEEHGIQCSTIRLDEDKVNERERRSE